MIRWISEGQRLPPIGLSVFVAHPRQSGEFWDIKVQCLLCRHEDVIPKPIKAGSRWPTDYYWRGIRAGRDDVHLVTGNSYWALMNEIPLPPGAMHREINGQ